MQKIKIIILDFDGTIGDTVKVIINTMQATIRELHLPARTDEQCKKMIGLTLMDTPAALFPELHKMPSEDSNEFHKRKEQLSTSFTETYRRIFFKFNTPGAVTLFPNVLPTLKKLKEQGIILTIASSRGNGSLTKYVEDLGMSDLISYTIGADNVKNAKPDPEPVLKTLEKFNCKPSEALVVGDTKYDIMMGVNAGAHTCGVTYGNGTRQEMLNAGAERVVDDFGEIMIGRYTMNIEKTIHNLQLHGFEVELVSTVAEAHNRVINQLEKLQPQIVAAGDSMTLLALNVLGEVKELSPKFLQTFSCKVDAQFAGTTAQGSATSVPAADSATVEISRTQLVENRREALLSDLFITGVNGISEDGSLHWIDMTGNRCAAVTFGPKHVILVAGTNKISPTPEAAIERIRQIAAPQNVKRHPNFKTPCAATGKCQDCNAPDRICNIFLSMPRCFPKGRIHLILIDKALGL